MIHDLKNKLSQIKVNLIHLFLIYFLLNFHLEIEVCPRFIFLIMVDDINVGQLSDTMQNYLKLTCIKT